MTRDPHDPVVRHFVDALVALPAREWDAIDARYTARARAMVAEGRLERNPRLENFMARTLNILQPSDAAMERIALAMMGMNRRLMERIIGGPAWRRQGTGPFRLLHEVLERPYVDKVLRMHVLLVVSLMQQRAQEPFAARLPDLYAPFEPSIPWASLVPPLLPATAATPDSRSS